MKAPRDKIIIESGAFSSEYYTRFWETLMAFQNLLVSGHAASTHDSARG